MTAELSPTEIRACIYALSAVRRGHLTAGRRVPPSVEAAWHRLRSERLHLPRSEKRVARPRQDDRPGLANCGVSEWLGAKAAAAEIGCSVRTVQRHRDAIGGEMFGGRLLFPANEVSRYARLKAYERQRK